jgi:CHAD domain-containing protein
MAFELNPAAPIVRQLKRLARQRLRRGCKQLRRHREDGVHEARTSVKKVRAIVNLLQKADARAIHKSGQQLRKAGRILGALRDADAAIATLDVLRRRSRKRLPEHTHAIVKRQLARVRSRRLQKARLDKSVAQAAQILRSVRRAVKRWDVPSLKAVDLAPLLESSYRACRQAMRRARETSTATDLHQWRKRVKTLFYQLRLTKPYASRLARDVARWKQLEQYLGESHDLSMLDASMVGEAVASGAAWPAQLVTDLSSTLQASLRGKAFSLGRRLLARRPKLFARDLKRALSRRHGKRRSSPRRSSAGSRTPAAA